MEVSTTVTVILTMNVIIKMRVMRSRVILRISPTTQTPTAVTMRCTYATAKVKLYLLPAAVALLLVPCILDV